PCAPQNVSATLVCSNHSALVSWVGSPKAESYNVTMTGRDGHTHHCHTNTTSCQLPGIHCGETYSITVTPSSKTCTGHPSAVYSFQAGLCAPVNVTVSPACEDSTVSWTHVTGAEMYVATATAADGHNHTCGSNYSSSCSFTGLHCGETYTVTVVTVDRGCWSEPSSAVELRTALCPPTNLTGRVSCDTNALTLTWDPSPVSGVTYALQTDPGGQVPPSVYTTSNTSHTLTNGLCGQRYAVRIAAQDGNCRGSYSSPIEISTAPCQPTDLIARVDCGSNKGNFSWLGSSGVSFYTVEVTGRHGHVASCSSDATSCAVRLDCGRSYSATLVASTESCNSSRHADVHFDSAPCLMEDVSAELHCSTNVMDVSWTETGSDNYTAWAISADGHRASCNATSNSCSIRDLRCGEVYEVAVTPSSIHCPIIAGSDYKVQTAPCKPENTTVDQSCSSNTATVQWSQGSAPQNNTVTATSASGVNSTRDSTESSYSFLDLSCGQLYTFTPDGLSVTFHCNNQSAQLSWTPIDNAVDYYGCAQAGNGDMLHCHSRNPTCTIQDLDCGTVYNFSVQASDGKCNSSFGDPVQSGAAPCPPDNVTVKLMAMQMEIQVMRFSWTEVTCNDTDYILKLTGSLLGDSQAQFDLSSYWTSTTYFEIPLPCGSAYSATVESRNAAGTSNPSGALNGTTAPCPPSGVAYGGNSSFATVSWNASVFATTFRVYDNSVKPKARLCSTAGLRRDLSVKRPETENGGLSAPVLDVKPATSTGIFVGWSQIETATHYSLMIRKQGSSSEPEEMRVYGESIVLTDLSPDSIYCVWVSARNSATSGPQSEPVCVHLGEGLPQ
ncbi:hypothetical protein FQN60_016157, partial [Etheostoma spectabile]